MSRPAERRPTKALRPVRRVLLIYPFTVIDARTIYGVARDEHGTIVKGDKIEPSLGLGYIKAFLRETRRDLIVNLLDANAMAIRVCIKANRVDLPTLWDALRHRIEEHQPDLVGISCFSLVTAASTRDTALLVKDLDATIHTVIGGNYANTSHDEALHEETGIDFVAFGEGEAVLADLIDAINEGRDLATVTGIAYRDSAGAIVKTPPRALLADLDSIPECDRSGFDTDFYATQGNYFVYRFMDRATTRIAPILASRGCQWRCSFCTARLIWGSRLRYRDPKLVVDEMARLRDESGINTFTFFDANLVGSRRRFLALADEMIKRLPGIRWVSIEGMHVSALSEDVIAAIIESGCRWFVLPFESSNAQTLRRIGKTHRPEEMPAVIEAIRRHDDTWISGNLITGFPFETKADISHSLDYAKTLDLDWLYIYRFIPFPGIQMYQECLDAGYTKKYAWDESHIGDLFVLDTPQFDGAYVAERNYELNAEVNFIRNRNIIRRPEQAIRDFQYVLIRSLNNALAMYGMARAHEQLGQLAEAEHWYDRTLQALHDSAGPADGEGEREGDDRSMESISKSFVVIRSRISYGKYFDAAGIDVGRALRRVRAARGGQRHMIAQS